MIDRLLERLGNYFLGNDIKKKLDYDRAVREKMDLQLMNEEDYNRVRGEISIVPNLYCSAVLSLATVGSLHLENLYSGAFFVIPLSLVELFRYISRLDILRNIENLNEDRRIRLNEVAKRQRSLYNMVYR